MYLFSVSLEVKHCNIPCPNDCKMAQWSEWSKCPSKCRPGIQKRSRYIEQLNSAGGRQCPSLDSTQTETQTRLCHPECSQYIWKAYEWSMWQQQSYVWGWDPEESGQLCDCQCQWRHHRNHYRGQLCRPGQATQWAAVSIGVCRGVRDVRLDWVDRMSKGKPFLRSLLYQAYYTHCIYIELNSLKSIRFHVLVCVGKNCVFQSQIIKILDLDIVLFLHTAMLKRIPKTDSYS